MTGDDGNPFKTPGVSDNTSFNSPNPTDNPFAGDADATVAIPQAGSATNKTIIHEPSKPAKPSSDPRGGGGGSSDGGGSNPFKPAAGGSSSGGGKPWDDPNHTCSETELVQWEADLKKREERMGGYKPPNWPSWPKPCARVAIDEDITLAEENSHVTQLYYCWFANCFALFWNCICVCAYVNREDESIEIAILGLVYWLLGMVASFYLWFRLAYVAAETQSKFKYMVFLFVFGLSIAFWIAVCVGIPMIAMSGMIVMLELFENEHDAAGCLCLVGLVIYGSLTLWMTWLWYRALALYRAQPDDD